MSLRIWGGDHHGKDRAMGWQWHITALFGQYCDRLPERESPLQQETFQRQQHSPTHTQKDKGTPKGGDVGKVSRCCRSVVTWRVSGPEQSKEQQ